MTVHVCGLPQAVAIMDLAMAGVRVEMDEAPFDWLGRPAAAAAAAAVAAPVAEEAKRVFPPLSLERKEAVTARVVAPMLVPVGVADVPGQVWTYATEAAAAANVLLVVEGAQPDARSQQLAKALLAAAGLPDAVPGWVGYEGRVTADALRAEVIAAKAAPILVMGQGPLGLLLGRSLGVEGWHAAGGDDTLGLEGAVGVTYPLELLLKQPLFKRLAWQHVRAWRARFMTINTKNTNTGVDA